jgi:hypothetical protein
MKKLNFHPYKFKFKNIENKPYIFDQLRKKYLLLTPEEWVRQHVVNFLIFEKKYPVISIAIEKAFVVNHLSRRADLVVYNKLGGVEVVVECKSSSVAINQQTFDQIARYNLHFKAKYLMVTNGLLHIFCKIDENKGGYVFLEELPEYTKTK